MNSLLVLTACCLMLQVTAAADGGQEFYQIELFVTKTDKYAVEFKFNSNPAISSPDYYYCIQTTLRWSEFDKTCNDAVSALPNGQWMTRTIDDLNFWDKDYHLRITLCRKISGLFVYCDPISAGNAKFIARSPTVTFHTSSGEFAMKEDTSDQAVVYDTKTQGAQFYQIEVFITDKHPNAVDFRFRANPAISDSSYYYCLQTTLRWTKFKKECDKTIAVLRDNRWINETIDDLDFWDRDYHLRINLCRKISHYFVYCDEISIAAELITRSPTVTFHTPSGEEKVEKVEPEAWKEFLIAASLVLSVTLALLTALIVILCKRNTALNRKMKKVQGKKCGDFEGVGIGPDASSFSSSPRYRVLDNWIGDSYSA